MPSELTLRLRVDPVTGKREVVVDYTSDADALPIEHEDEHRRLAGKVIEGGLGNNSTIRHPYQPQQDLRGPRLGGVGRLARHGKGCRRTEEIPAVQAGS